MRGINNRGETGQSARPLHFKYLQVLALFILLALPAYTAGQTFTITQDARLALLGDGRGNDPFTPNVTLKAQVHDFNNSVGYLTIGIKAEYAELISGDYWRYGIEAGHAVRLPYKITLTPLLGYGVIVRQGFTWQSIEGSLEATYSITDNWAVIGLHTYTQRSEWELWRYSFSIGLQYKL